MRTILIVAAAALCAAALQGAAWEDKTMVGHWRLRGNCMDSSGAGNHGANQGATLTDGGAVLDGKGAHIVVPDSASLHLGTGDLTVSAMVRCADGARVTGDIVGKFDPALRKGLNLHVSASAPGYSSISDSRNVLFGIDNAVEGEWEDCGRPVADNPLISTLIVYKGHLYTGTADAKDPKDACHVYRYAGGRKWVDCGRVTTDLKTPSIYSIIVHKGKLYAGLGAWDWEKAWAGDTGISHVYRYEGGKRWRDCGQFGAGYRVMSLASFGGELYAADDKQMTYRFDGDRTWTPCGKIDAGTKFHATMVYRDMLWGASNTTIHRFDGKGAWPIVGQFDVNVINQIHTFGIYGGELYAGTWPVGTVLRYDGDNRWTGCGDLGVPTNKVRINEVNELTTYNGKLYAGLIPRAQVWRYEDGSRWTMLRELVDNRGYVPESLPTWSRVPCMTVFQGRVYAGTSSCQGRTANADLSTGAGTVYAWEAGKSVTFDDDLGTDWRHVTAVRAKGRLKLYVDGRRVATSTPFDATRFDLTNDKPLLIGFGAGTHFAGSLRDVRLYRRALTPAEVAGICREDRGEAEAEP